jgi:aspartyl-tRNA(Asn)/glutamyl-tRNA(Gln) amidotransferase subunit A
MNETHFLGARDLARGIRGRRFSPIDVLEAQIERIDRFDGRLKSFLAVTAEEGRAAARAAEAAVTGDQPLGPLHGVSVSVKDVFDVAGSPTTAGSKFLTRPAERDSTAVARLRAAGAIILGKLNLHEFAYGPEGINPTYGTSWNPWDATTHRLPGGSSSGSAVAVAAGLVPAALGTDTGGSIRIPAACCGIVGLKPTYGRVSRAGVWPLSWSLDHVGPLTRSVEDAALLLSVIAGHDPADPTSSRQPVPDYVGALEGPVRGLRVGVVESMVAEAGEEVRDAVRAAVEVLRGVGCAVEEVALPLARYSAAASFAVVGPEAWSFHEPLLRRHAPDYAPDVRRRILAAAFLTARDYLSGQRARRLIRAEIDDRLRPVDCLLAPTLPVSAPPVGATEVAIDGRAVATRPLLTMFTRLFNLSGHPVIAVPCGFSAGGMPLSMQLVGRAFDEAALLRVAHAYESATPWHRRRPPLASEGN